MDILIVKLSALGDVLRTTALLPALRKRYPAARTTWATSGQAKPLLAGNPFLRSVVLPSSLRGRAFDLVLSLEEDIQAAGLARRACRGAFIGVYPEGGRLRYTSSSAPYYGMSLLRPAEEGGKPAADRLKAANRLSYARLWLSILGLPTPLHSRPILRLSPAEREAGRSFLRRLGVRRPPIGFNPGAGRRWPSKQLSEEASSRWAAALAQRSRRPVLLLGGPDEKARNRRILAQARRFSEDPGLIVDGKTHPLRRFASIVGACRALVTTDSLALHMGAALGVRTVAAVGPTSAAELDLPRGAALQASCRCFYRPRCRLARSCLDRLPEARLQRALARIC